MRGSQPFDANGVKRPASTPEVVEQRKYGRGARFVFLAFGRIPLSPRIDPTSATTNTPTQPSRGVLASAHPLENYEGGWGLLTGRPSQEDFFYRHAEVPCK